MNRKLILPLLLAAAPLVGQQPAVADKPVAVVNGETINAQRLDAQWSAIGTKARDQYKENGGKPAFLNNYLINRRLIVQEAIKSGFDKQPDVQAEVEAAKEKALFDRYVRDVVSASIVTEPLIRKYYDEHPQDFAVPEKIKVRHIVLVANPAMPNGLTKEEALERIKQVAVELHTANASIKATDPATAERLRIAHFADLAKKYSMDNSGSTGGDLGWVARGSLDPQFEEAAWSLKKGMPSGIVETRYGYHLIFLEDKKEAGSEPYEDAKPAIREFLMAEKAAEIVQNVTKLTNELRGASKIAVYPENIR